MKTKLFYFVLFFVLANVAGAQTFGVKGGINFANVSISSSGWDISPKSIVGIHVGPIVEFELQESLFFNTGLLYSLKGYKVEMDDGELEGDGKEKLNVIEIPMNFAYKFALSESSNFVIQAGPYLGYAMSGKSEWDGHSEDIEFGDDGYKRFDFGIGFGPALEFGPVVASLNYQLGLANMADDEDVKVKNKVFQISLAYMFGK